MKFAIIQTGGKQYKVQEGTSLKVEKLEVEAGANVTFDKVLLTYDETTGLKVGKPFIEGVSLQGEVIKQAKGPKIIIFKYKPKKRERKKTGHRQPYTLVKIAGMGGTKAEKQEKEKQPAAKASSKSKAIAKKSSTRAKTKARQ